jgi:hypothetical protein
VFKMLFICPRAEECPLSCQSKHKEPHGLKDSCKWEGFNCPACVPVPSTPAKPEIKIKVCKGVVDNKEHIITVPVPSTPASVLLPPELLTDEEIEEEISFHIKMVLEGVASCLSHFERVDYQKVAEVAAIDILAKCRQSESAEIASLQADIEELNILSRGNSEVYEARIKELEKYKQPEYEKAILQQARADQNKKIGEEMMRHVRAESELPPRWVADLIAKLQKGELENG